MIFFFLATSLALDAYAQSFCVNKPGAVLRSAPQGSAPPSWKVPKFMPLLGTGEKKGSWYEVTDIDGQKHWANVHDVSTQMACVVVKVKKARIRTGPGNNFETSSNGVADRYSAFIDQGGEDGWTQVEDEMGQKGWVNLDQVWKPHRKMRMSFDGE